MNTPKTIPALCATLTDADLDEIEATLGSQAAHYQTAGHAFQQRTDGIRDSLSLIHNWRKNIAKTRRPFCLIPSNFFLN